MATQPHNTSGEDAADFLKMGLQMRMPEGLAHG
jgi:hypothetical protein